MDIKFTTKKFSELSVKELYELLKLRISIFCVEQNCIYNDCDDHDQNSYHVLYFENKQLIAYCRIMPPGEKHKESSISRVTLLKELRGSGIANKLMKYTIDETQRLFPNDKIRIDAQAHLEKFYNRFDFIKEGEPFLWDGILHVQMLLL